MEAIDDKMAIDAKMPLSKIKFAFRELGISFNYSSEWKEYRVNFIGGKEATKYFTDDKEDAIQTAWAMAKERAQKGWRQ